VRSILKVSVPDLDDSSFAPLFCTTPSAARRMHHILEGLWQHGGLALNSFQSGRSGVLAAFSISHTLAL